MKILWKSLAALGGRSFEEMRDCAPADCDKSIWIGTLCALSIGIIFGGYLLFWRSFPHLSDSAPAIAGGIAAVFALVYRVTLRAIETTGTFGKVVMLVVLLGLMGVNASLAGHEVPLFAFQPQVDAQAMQDAQNGVTGFKLTVEDSLGLPTLRKASTDLNDALTAARAERERVPDDVKALQQQARACDAAAAQLKSRIPADAEEPGFDAANSLWREQRARCAALTRQATAALNRHIELAEAQLDSLAKQRNQVQRSLLAANSQQEEILKREKPKLMAGATTGFARHAALWAAVRAGRVPGWAAYGLMFTVIALDALSFILKLLVRDDPATARRIQAANADLLFNTLHAELMHQNQTMVRKAVRDLAGESMDQLLETARSSVLPSVVQDLDARAFERANRAARRAQANTGKPAPALIQRLVQMATAMRRRSGRSRAYGAHAAA